MSKNFSFDFLFQVPFYIIKETTQVNIFNKKANSIKSILAFLFKLLFEPWKDYYFKYFRAFGVPISLRSRNKLRLSRGFETKQYAIKRSTTEKN